MLEKSLCYISHKTPPDPGSGSLQSWIQRYCETNGFLIHPSYVMTCAHKGWAKQDAPEYRKLNDIVWVVVAGLIGEEPFPIRDGKVIQSCDNGYPLDGAVIELNQPVRREGEKWSFFDFYRWEQREACLEAANRLPRKGWLFRWQSRWTSCVGKQDTADRLVINQNEAKSREGTENASPLRFLGEIGETLTLSNFTVQSGESGCPLCDENGKVIGFIIAGSVDERNPPRETHFVYAFDVFDLMPLTHRRKVLFDFERRNKNSSISLHLAYSFDCREPASDSTGKIFLLRKWWIVEHRKEGDYKWNVQLSPNDYQETIGIKDAVVNIAKIISMHLKDYRPDWIEVILPKEVVLAVPLETIRGPLLRLRISERFMYNVVRPAGRWLNKSEKLQKYYRDKSKIDADKYSRVPAVVNANNPISAENRSQLREKFIKSEELVGMHIGVGNAVEMGSVSPFIAELILECGAPVAWTVSSEHELRFIDSLEECKWSQLEDLLEFYAESNDVGKLIWDDALCTPHSLPMEQRTTSDR